jgi:type II restriction/modification system DNA methylase subunit YeeA
MNRYFQKTLLTLFALLQCIAPITHAHIDGDNDVTHAHKLNTQASTGNSYAENQGGQTISTQRAYRLRDSSSDDHSQISPSFNRIDLVISNIAFAPPHKANTSPSNTPHLSPWPQAPPRFS